MGHRVALIALATAAVVGVLGCGGARKPTPTKPTTSFSSHCDNCGTSQANLKTFVRYWWGHGRGLRVYRSGRGRESARASLNRPPFNATLTFEVLGVSGSRTAADARIRVITVQNTHRTFPRVRVGQVGTLRLRHGIVTDALTHGTYCAPHVDRCGL
jgi:hypothetical protein